MFLDCCFQIYQPTPPLLGGDPKRVGKSMRNIIPYNPELVALAKQLRQNMTLGEIALWREIKSKQLGVRFSRQVPIDQFIVDFYCKDLQLAIEVDGAFHFKEGQKEKDHYRQQRLESLGVNFIRFSDLDIKNNLSWVLGELKNIIQQLAPTPNPSQEGKNTKL